MSQPSPGLPPQQVVVVKSGCGKVAIILGIIIGLICLAIGGCFILGAVGISKVGKQVTVELEKQAAERKALVDSLEITSFAWDKDAGLGNVMEASFTIHNKGTQDLKDIEIECTHYAPSGTKIDSNTRTVYEIVKAGESRTFTKFNMGFIHDQANKSVAVIKSAAKVPAGSVEIPASPAVEKP
jgi:hypothetical protein